MKTTTRDKEYSAEGVLYLALELSVSKWKLGSTVAQGQKPRIKTIEAGDLEALHEEIFRARERFELPATARVVSCYEAGRDGFWIHRHLVKEGIENVVVDAASMEVNRRKRRAKTDRIDVRKLVVNLIRWREGEEKVWSVVQVPSEEDEDARQFHRELQVLKKERTRHSNRITSLLATQGIRVKTVGAGFLGQLGKLRTWDGTPLPPQLRSRLERECELWEAVNAQIMLLVGQRREALRVSEDARIEKVRRLQRLKGIGENSSWLFIMEMFGWRQFENRRQVGSLVGLAPTPYDSGGAKREQGIDKSGNARVRAMAVEIAWCWLRFQPESELSKWFQNRFGHGSKRMRRIGIVALARKLMIALWRYLDQGIVPEGAVVIES